MKKSVKIYSRNTLFVILGSFIFSLGISLFITPIHIYSGGVMGFSQIMRTLLVNAGNVFPFEISGLINFAINIPLMFIAYRSISKRFFYLTFVSILAQTLFFTLMPIPKNPILDDMLASCLVGGIISGFGVGFILRSRGSGGGLDILGVFISRKAANFSVGKLSLIVNTCLFTMCAVLFTLETAIYSMIYLVVFTFVVDKVHYQNINMTAMIFTKHEEVMDYIINHMHRGVTYWEGAGGYTKEGTYIMITAISKYEIHLLKNRVKKIDANAFIIFSEGLSVSGNFEKRL
ncbi:uncharacterized membrane-anchored protein YitT (DUF2179 family) [Breznakia sp. PF5-3]|uniref:YitT family protein n=1 Tax=unclassified Breznakia TaxID=2623764 RepID=UPI0024060D7A|nr:MULTISPECIES: YitT family protein [unclassified Breznakia]MDF9824630.1 uncharacterized membrane-anchored protein YitT (DUF2179 family) [Breznakia sp. PM6-1]MDF9835566.1 uncharacterized membrane-anchored protein YitT (DUF2179 family) [Breznakia sp. PF5-3]MDF9838684.1 uncharacterized membrane-anchored protein YitT (DUF2179 family) [Breznakia sp. PFB2-8]MDF9860715.1 uncharacterized membrane-anchored protein YitT (DUF2179 family) [Breznakia sp. PH5-24]